MNIGVKIKDNVYAVRDRLEGYKAERKERKESRKEIKDIRLNTQYEESQKYLNERREFERKQNVVNLARQKRRESSPGYKLVSGLSSASSPKKSHKPLANVSRSSLFSSGNVKTGTFDNPLFRGNMKK